MTLPAGNAQGPQPVRDITNISGDLYLAQNDNNFTVFLVTSEGIILADPIGTPFANWLKAELDDRFDVPVRYVVYTHSHFDRSEGGAAFEDTAQFVAHENMVTMMDGRIPQMPGDMLDRNGNGRFELEELNGPLLNNRCGIGQAQIARLDRNSDGAVTMPEYYAEIVPPDLSYSERMRLTLGGQAVELMHPGLNHAADATVMRFPAERVVFTSGYINSGGSTGGLRRWPAACGTIPGFDSHPLAEWVKSFRAVEDLDFDLLLNGHGDARLTKADLVEERRFFEDLVAEVSRGMSAGLGLEELKETLLFEDYADWGRYEIRRLWTIEAAYNNLTIYR